MSEALKVYEQLCKDKHIEHNIKQKDLVIELDKFLLGSSRNFIKKLFRYNSNQKKCFYLYGGVGIGKTLIMDLFYDDVNLKEKQRVHFHEFMIDIHDQLHQLRNEKNSRDFIISKLVKGIKSKSSLIFFDEFQVTNIADAMITNFHTPKSCLLMMVCAFGGFDLIMEAYQEAIKKKYNFFSYGDAMLII